MLDRLLELVGLPSPAVLLAVIIAISSAAGWGYHLGDGNGYNRAEAKRATVQDAVVEALRSQLETQAKRADAAEAAARAIADKESSAKASLETVLKEIRNAKPTPATCFDGVRDKLNSAITNINAYTGSGFTVSLPTKLPAATGAGK